MVIGFFKIDDTQKYRDIMIAILIFDIVIIGYVIYQDYSLNKGWHLYGSKTSYIENVSNKS